MGGRVYLHEVIDVILSGRANYFEHMTVGAKEFIGHRDGMKLFGIWGTFGSTARWPEVINIWEYRDWDAMVGTFAHEVRGRGNMQDPGLAKWWLKAQEFRSGGFDRLMEATPFSPDLDELVAAGVVGYDVFRHEIVGLKAGTAPDYIAKVEAELIPYMKTLGVELVGCYRTLLRDDSEVILVWGCKTWEDWGKAEMEYDRSAKGKAWRASVRDIITDFKTDLMCSGPKSPLQTGTQP